MSYNIKDYGAPVNGVDDDSIGIQSAIDAAYSNGGGTVKLPAGRIVLKSDILVKPGVCIQGDNWFFDPSKHDIRGTVISVEVGKGDEEKAAVVMNTASEIKDVAFEYADQLEDMSEPHIYGPTIRLYQHTSRNDSPYHKVTIKNIFFYKSYCAIDMRGNNARWNNEAANIVTCRIEDILMSTLRYGIRMNNITDWTFFTNIEQQPGFIGHYIEQGLSLRDYAQKNCVVFECTGVMDWVKFTNCSAWASQIGVLFENASNPVTFIGCEFDACRVPFYGRGNCGNLEVKVIGGTFTSFDTIEREHNSSNFWSSFVFAMDYNTTFGTMMFDGCYLFGPSKGWVWIGWNNHSIKNIQLLNCTTNVINGDVGVNMGPVGAENCIISNNIFDGINLIWTGNCENLVEAQNIIN